MRSLVSLLAAVAAVPVLALSGHEAHACGGFFARGPDLPALEFEQTLIVHDPVKQVEHFVREVTFRKGNVTFGFVVPTPSTPEVAKVDDPPFKRLHDELPFAARGASRGGSGGAGFGSKGGVEVLSVQKVGSFTAFVLSATDAGGLAKWLASNKFETTPASSRWLEHYVALKFYFVAFRFDPPAKDADAGAPARAVSSETMRISFATPLPYYPYLEPDHAEKTPKTPRVLDVWFVSPSEATPVAAVQGEGGAPFRWKRPWLEGASTRMSVEALKPILGRSLAGLLPAPKKAEGEGDEPTLSVQIFEDQKFDRHGFGDVVLVPNTPVELGEAELARRRAFFDVLDPARGAK